MELSRSGADTTPVSLAAEGAPAWVSVDFSPAVLTGATVQSTMSVSTDAGHPDAEPATFDITVKAVGAGNSAQATLSVVVALQDVSGTVVSPFGEPLVGMQVHTNGKAGVVTDVDGKFTLTQMTAPYDLTIISSGLEYAHQFLGLTTTSPRVIPAPALSSALSGGSNAVVSGTLDHPTLIPLAADHAFTVCVEAISDMALGCSTTFAGQSSYSVTVSWPGSGTIDVRLRGYVYELDVNEMPKTIVASGTTATTVLSSGGTPTLDMTLADTIGQASMTLTTSLPVGYKLDIRAIISGYSEQNSFAMNTGTPTGTTATAIAPFFEGAELTAVAMAVPNLVRGSHLSIAWSTGHASGDASTLALATPPTPLSPPAGSTGVSTTTDFTVANPDGGVLTYVIQPDFGSGDTGPTFAVTTADSTARLPDLASLGMGLPSGEVYFWGANASHDVPTVDAAVTGQGYLGDYFAVAVALSGGGYTPEADGRMSSTDNLPVITQ